MKKRPLHVVTHKGHELHMSDGTAWPDPYALASLSALNVNESVLCGQYAAAFFALVDSTKKKRADVVSAMHRYHNRRLRIAEYQAKYPAAPSGPGKE